MLERRAVSCGGNLKIRGLQNIKKIMKCQIKIGGLSNGLSHWVKYQWLVSTLGNCRCGGVGWDSSCEREGSYLMHDMEHFI